MKFKQLAYVSFIYYIQLLTIGIKTWIKLPYSAKLYEKNNCSYHLKVTQRSLRRSPKHCFRHSPRHCPNYSPKHSPFLHSLFWFLKQPPLIHPSMFFGNTLTYYKWLHRYLTQEKLLNLRPSGFPQGRYTDQAITKLVDQILYSRFQMDLIRWEFFTENFNCKPKALVAVDRRIFIHSKIL